MKRLVWPGAKDACICTLYDADHAIDDDDAIVYCVAWRQPLMTGLCDALRTADMGWGGAWGTGYLWQLSQINC